MSSALSAAHFHDENAATAYVEARIWPNDPVCPHCGGCERIGKMAGKSTRSGLWKCYQCRKPFTVKIGTIFESSHVALHIWLQAMYLIAGSKKGISSNQLHRILGVTLKTAWFMSHRIREAMRTGGLAPMGGNGGVVEVDETYIGVKQGATQRKAYHHKMAVLSLVDRTTGEARSAVVGRPSKELVEPIMRANLAREARLMTDEAYLYRGIGKFFAAMKASATALASTCAAKRIPTPLKASFRSSNAGCAAFTSIAGRSTCTATWPSSISATPTAWRWAAMTLTVPTPCLRASLASG